MRADLSTSTSLWDELSFLALPGQITDWRKALLFDLAAEAGILGALPAAPAEAAAGLGLDAHAVRVVLEALAVWGVVEMGPDATFAAGPDAPDSDAAAVLCHHGRAIRGWSTSLEDRLRGVRPPPGSFGPARVKLMLDALVVNAAESAPGVVDACLDEVPGARTVLDVGGGHGRYAVEFARRGLAATLQDRPAVLEAAVDPGPLAEAGVEVFAGDFFQSLPEAVFDIVFCAGVTYTFDAERNTALYRRLRPLVAPGGVLAVMTFLGGTDELAAVFAVQMLAGGGGGDSHREADHRAWLADAGYGEVTARRLERRPEWLLVARP